MPATYDSIATTTLSTTQNEITFTSIAGTYTDLVIVANGGVTSTNDIWLRFNSDTGTNYSRTRMTGSGSAAASTRNSAFDSILINAGTVGSNANFIINIMNYANATTFKTAVSRFNSSSFVVASVGLWRSTSAITSVSLRAGSADTFTSGSTFSLYGIKAA